MRLSKYTSSISFDIKLATIALYYPRVKNGPIMKFIIANTQVLYQNRRDLTFELSFVFQLLGFGFGLAINHCDNKNYDHKRAVAIQAETFK